MNRYRLVVCVGVAVAAAVAASGALAQGVISEWSRVKAPPAPELNEVTIDPTKTALLLMDFSQNNCPAVKHCVAYLPHIKMLLDQARAHHMLVVYSGRPPMMSELTPRAGEPLVEGRGGNRFYNTNMDDILKQHGITTVIDCGIVANGTVLFTSAAAAAYGYHAIVPVDCMPALTSYDEQAVAWGVARDPGLSPHPPRPPGNPAEPPTPPPAGQPVGPPPGYATLTSSDKIHFG